MLCDAKENVLQCGFSLCCQLTADAVKPQQMPMKMNCFRCTVSGLLDEFCLHTLTKQNEQHLKKAEPSHNTFGLYSFSL